MENSSRAEFWVPIVGYEGYYEVSNYGKVRSLDRTITVDRQSYSYDKRLKSIEKAIGLDGNGRPKVELDKYGKSHSINIHVLVAQHFVLGRKPGLIVCHKDGNEMNNHASNLYWGTYIENAQDTIKHGNNYHLNKELCPRKHKLQEPNLRTSNAKYRRCLSCKKAQDSLKNNVKIRKIGINQLSDIYYELVMNGNLPKYFKIEKHLRERKII